MLTHTVKCAALFNDVRAIHTNNLTPGETISNNPNRGGIVFWLIVGRHEHRPIQNDKI